MQRLIFPLIILFLTHRAIIAQWQQQVTNLPNLHNINCISAVNENVCWVTAYKYPGTSPWLGYSRTTNGGASWVCDTIQSVTGIFNFIFALDANTAFVSVKNQGVAGRIYKTTDGGNIWQQQTVGFTVLNDAPKFIHFFDATDGIAIGSRQGNYFEIFITTDSGYNWTKVPEANLPVLFSNETLVGDDYTAEGNNIWFLTSESRIFKSTNKGLNWGFINSPENFSGGDPNIEFKDEMNGILIANYKSLWKTTDGGLNWSSVIYSGHITPRYISYVPSSYSTFVFASQGGSNYTPDGGNSFIPIDSIGHFHIDFASPSAGWVDGTVSGIIYRWVGNFVSVEDSNISVIGFQLEQNYPNPFNPTTKISYQIPVSSEVRLKIFDVLGSEIATLVNEEQPVGRYEVEFRTSAVSSQFASGIYFYQLKSGDYVQTRKMILLK
jgi:photosystem II stability/assembly factor-like uncharacterized protein